MPRWLAWFEGVTKMTERDSWKGCSVRRSRDTRAAWLLSALALSSAALGGCKKAARADAKAPNLVMAPAADGKHSLLLNASFKDGASLPWLTSWSAPAKGTTDVKDGALCLTLDDQANDAWDASLVLRLIESEQGLSYPGVVCAWLTAPTGIRPKVGMAGPPYAEYWAARLDVGT